MTQSTDTSKIITVEITSFSYKRPLPANLFSHDDGRHGGGFVFDCRCLPNPGREDRFKAQTGLDNEVINYLSVLPEVSTFKDHAFGLVSNAIGNYLARGFQFISVGFGCTGGQHRSVFMTEQLSLHIERTFPHIVSTKVVHSNLDGSGRPKGA